MSSSEEKTEAPTSHKLREARKLGDVAQSPELSGAAAFAAVFFLIWLASDFIFLQISDFFAIGLGFSPSTNGSDSLDRNVLEMLYAFLWIIVPCLVVSFLAAIFIGLIQTRGVFAADPLKIKFEKLNPAQSIKQLFSTHQLGIFITMLVKIILLLWLLVWVLRTYIGPMIYAIFGAAFDSLYLIAIALKFLFGAAAVGFVLFGLVHYILQYFEYLKRNKMSKSEQKNETKNLNGDPAIKAEFNRLRYEAATQSFHKNISMAQVVVTNPTHFAVALYYDPEVVEVPVVVAKGTDSSAHEIRVEAVKKSIPIIEYPALARSLYSKVVEGAYIDDEHLEAVAEVFRWLKLLKQEKDS